MEHLVEAERLHIGSRLLAADAAGAEHGDFLAFEFSAVFARPLREFTKTLGMGIDRIFEGAQRHFVVVAGVDDDRVGIGDQGIPVAGLDIGADGTKRIDVFHAHGDDFAFQANLHAMERHLGG